MMFTLSAPALAESTNALMQLSINSRSSIARLNEENSIPEDAVTLDIANGDIEVSVNAEGVQTATQDGMPITGVFVITGTSTTNKLVIKGDSGTAAKVYLKDLHITVSSGAAVSVSENVDLYIEGSSVLQSGENCAGIQKEDDGQLTIDGSGSLEATGGESGAGIGGAFHKSGNNITINGGKIIAQSTTGNGWGAGIGGGNEGNGNNITINGGDVTAIGGSEAAGIGGGIHASAENITINGGTVTAKAGGLAAAIGGGHANPHGGKATNINLVGGDITVQSNHGVATIGGVDGEITIPSTFGGSLTYLDANENKDATKTSIEKYGPVVNGKAVNSVNYADILGNGALSYDKDTKTLSLNKSYTDAGFYIGDLIINAPNTIVDLNGGIYPVLKGKLVIEDAADVTLTSTVSRAVWGDANITCTGKLSITCENYAVDGNLTVHKASEVDVSGKSGSGAAVVLAAKIECTCPVTIQNKDATKGAAGSISYSGDYVYCTADGGALTDPRITPIAANASYLRIVPSELHKVNVPDGCTVTLDGKNFDVDGKNFDTAHAGQTVTVTAPDKGAHFEFAGWTISPDNVTLNNADKLTATFTMPDGDVKLENSYNQLYDVTVKKGTATPSFAKEGTEITITADSIPGRKFERWDVLKGGVTLADKNSDNTTFNMPAGEVEVEAKYKMLQSITVNDGAYTVNGETTTEAVKGDKIVATANPAPEGEKFVGWDVVGVDGLTDEQKAASPIEFEMPKNGVELKAQYKTLHNIVVNKGTYTVNGTDDKQAVEGDKIAIKAAERPGYQFVRWEVVTDNVTIIGVNNEEATFTMPNENVELKARYNKLYTITVDGGHADVTSALTGKEITVDADVPEGEKFMGWKAEGITLTPAQQQSKHITFFMPEGNVTLTAEYKTLHTVTVIGADGTSTVLPDTYIEGDTVTVNAEKYGIPAGEFDHWESNDIRLTTDKWQSPTLTFKMVDKNVTLTAVPKTLFTITVTGGTVNGESTTARVKAGDWVTIKAENKGDDWKFIEWKLSGPENFTLDTSQSTVLFQMPSGNVTLEAVQMKYRTITVNGGTVNGETTITDALREQEVKIKAVYDPEEQVFDHWEAEGPDGWALTEKQKGSESFTLTVPKGNVTLKAVYKTLHTVTVIHGTAQNGETTIKAVAGEKINLTPNLPGDQEFDCWYSEDINLNEEQRKTPELTFKMRDFDITIEAKSKQLYFVELADDNTTANGVSGKVEVKSGEKVTIVAPEREGWKFIRWEVSDNAYLDDATASEAHFYMPSGNVSVRAVYYEYHTITMTDDKGIAYNEKGEEITRAVQGDVITIKAKDREDHEFNRWVITPDNGTLVGKNDPDEATFTMPDEAVVVDAKYKHLQGITVNGGAAYYMDGTPVETAKAGETIVIMAEDRSKDGLRFAYWEVNSDKEVNVEGGEKATFEMVNAPVELTAHYEAQITYSNDPAIFDEGVGLHEDIVWEKVGDTVSITAVLDNSTDEDHIGIFPGMTFDHWEIVTPKKLNVTSGLNSETITFEVPECEVKLIAHWKDTATVTPEEPLDPGFPVEPEAPAADGSGAVIGVAAAGAAIWGGYEITTRVILNDLLPEGAAIPTNRGELAMLIWTQKGKPEPAAEPAFTDVSDTELAKAAQWCVEQGLLTAEDGKFEPDGWTPKWRVIQVWNQAFPKE